MLISTLTQKGQATIPSTVRRSLGLSSGSKIQFVENKFGFQLRAISSLSSFRGSLKGKKLPDEKELELLFAREVIGRDKN